MTGENNAEPVSVQPAAQVQASGGSQEQGLVGEYLTEAKVLELLEERDQRLQRQLQSLSDKSESRLSKEIRAELQNVDKTVKALASQGITVPPEKIEALKSGVVANAFSSEPRADTSQAREETPPVDPTTAARLQELRDTFRDMSGDPSFDLADEDPEAQWLNSQKFSVANVRKAFKDKLARLASEKKSESAPAKASRAPGAVKGGSGPSIPDGLPAYEYFERAYAKK